MATGGMTAIPSLYAQAASLWPLTSVWPPQHSGVNSSDTQVLTLYNVTEEESGEYICKVSNYIGQANQSAWLTVTKHASTGNAPLTGALED